MKILLIDDNESMCKAVSKALELKGQQCMVSNDGREGLKTIQERKFDKILLDLSMPEFSGYDILDSLEKSGKIKELKIIVFTAIPISETEIEKLQGRGVYSCLKKPVKLDSLVKEVKG